MKQAAIVDKSLLLKTQQTKIGFLGFAKSLAVASALILGFSTVTTQAALPDLVNGQPVPS